jgi:hypothetical protein
VYFKEMEQKSNVLTTRSLTIAILLFVLSICGCGSGDVFELTPSGATTKV